MYIKPLEIETNLAKNPPETRSAGKIIDCRRKFIYLPSGFYLPAGKVFISCQWSRRFMPVEFHFHGSARNNGCFSLGCEWKLDFYGYFYSLIQTTGHTLLRHENYFVLFVFIGYCKEYGKSE